MKFRSPGVTTELPQFAKKCCGKELYKFDTTHVVLTAFNVLLARKFSNAFVRDPFRAHPIYSKPNFIRKNWTPHTCHLIQASEILPNAVSRQTS